MLFWLIKITVIVISIIFIFAGYKIINNYIYGRSYTKRLYADDDDVDAGVFVITLGIIMFFIDAVAILIGILK